MEISERAPMVFAAVIMDLSESKTIREGRILSTFFLLSTFDKLPITLIAVHFKILLSLSRSLVKKLIK